MAPHVSTLTLALVLPFSGSNLISHSVIAIGKILIAKIARHDSVSTKRPPTSGPTTNAIPVQAVQLPIAFAWDGPLKVEMMIAKELGTSSAPATPCNPRKSMSKVLVGAAAQSKEATPNPMRPQRKIFSLPNKSDSEPAISMSEPRVKR
jgi:hypothetical protein